MKNIIRIYGMLMTLILCHGVIISNPGNNGSLAVLASYGLGDSPINAQQGYLPLAPHGIEDICVPVFSRDSLYSAIFNPSSYVTDLHQVTCDYALTEKSFVAIGHSRGAEMLIHYVGECNPVTLKALVLVATPASVGAVVMEKLLRKLKKLPARTLQSIKKIKNKQLPIMLLHQLGDSLVPVAHTQALYQAFKDQGFENVSVVYMNSGDHNLIIDVSAYKSLQQFYKNNNLPYNVKAL